MSVDSPPGGGGGGGGRGTRVKERERTSAMLFSLPGRCDRRMLSCH